MFSFNGRIAVSTSAFYKTTIFEAISLIHSAGYKYVEVFAKKGHFSCNHRESVNKVKHQLSKLNLVPVSFHAPFGQGIDLASLDEKKRAYAVWLQAQACEAASIIGCPIMVLHPSGHAATEPEGVHLITMQLKKSMDELLTVSLKLKVKIALENITPRYMGGSYEGLFNLVDHYRKRGVGICLDTSHAHLYSSVPKMIRSARETIITTHISDNKQTSDDHLPPGSGTINWDEAFSTFNAVGYRGFLTLELIKPESDRGSWYSFLRRAGYALKNRIRTGSQIPD